MTCDTNTCFKNAQSFMRCVKFGLCFSLCLELRISLPNPWQNHTMAEVDSDSDVEMTGIQLAPEPFEHDLVSLFILGVPLAILKVLVLVARADSLPLEARMKLCLLARACETSVVSACKAIPPALVCLEMFAGVQSICRGIRRQGWNAHGFDIVNDPVRMK